MLFPESILETCNSQENEISERMNPMRSTLGAHAVARVDHEAAVGDNARPPKRAQRLDDKTK